MAAVSWPDVTKDPLGMGVMAISGITTTAGVSAVFSKVFMANAAVLPMSKKGIP